MEITWKTSTKTGKAKKCHVINDNGIVLDGYAYTDYCGTIKGMSVVYKICIKKFKGYYDNTFAVYGDCNNIENLKSHKIYTKLELLLILNTFPNIENVLDSINMCDLTLEKVIKSAEDLKIEKEIAKKSEEESEKDDESDNEESDNEELSDEESDDKSENIDDSDNIIIDID